MSNEVTMESMSEEQLCDLHSRVTKEKIRRDQRSEILRCITDVGFGLSLEIIDGLNSSIPQGHLKIMERAFGINETAKMSFLKSLRELTNNGKIQHALIKFPATVSSSIGKEEKEVHFDSWAPLYLVPHWLKPFASKVLSLDMANGCMVKIKSNWDGYDKYGYDWDDPLTAKCVVDVHVYYQTRLGLCVDIQAQKIALLTQKDDEYYIYHQLSEKSSDDTRSLKEFIGCERLPFAGHMYRLVEKTKQWPSGYVPFKSEDTTPFWSRM